MRIGLPVVLAARQNRFLTWPCCVGPAVASTWRGPPAVLASWSFASLPPSFFVTTSNLPYQPREVLCNFCFFYPSTRGNDSVMRYFLPFFCLPLFLQYSISGISLHPLFSYTQALQLIGINFLTAFIQALSPKIFPCQSNWSFFFTSFACMQVGVCVYMCIYIVRICIYIQLRMHVYMWIVDT